MKSLSVIILFFLMVSITNCNKSETSTARVEDRIVDRVGVLTEAQKQSLFQQVMKLENELGPQIAVLIVDSIGTGQTVEQFSASAISELKLGREKYQDGVVIAAVMRTRELKIVTGSGLEQILHGPATLRIIKEKIAPDFRQGNYYNGLASGIETIETLLQLDTDKIGKKP